MVTYYCRFIHNCAQNLHPLINLLKCNPKYFTMTPGAEAAFATIKQHLSNATKLSHLSTSNNDPQAAVRALLTANHQTQDSFIIIHLKEINTA